MKAKIQEYPDGRVSVSLEAENDLEQLQLSIFENQISQPQMLMKPFSHFPGYSVIRTNGGRVRSVHMLEALTLEAPMP